MAKKVHKLRGMKVNKDNMRLELGTEHLNNRLNFAQYALDSAVMTSMEPFMPMDTGQFINVTKAMSAAIAGSGKVVAAAPPHGRYLYFGNVMVDSATGKGPMKIEASPGEYIFRFRKGAKLTPTKRKLNYSRGSAKARWFEEAKKRDRENWQSVIDKAMKSK